MAVVTNVDADAGVTGLEYRVAGVPRREIKFLPKARMTMRNMVLAVFAEVAAVPVDDCGGVEIDAVHFDFVSGHNEDHLIFLSELLHERDRGAVGNTFGQFIPTGLLLGAEVRAIEKLLEAEDLHLFLGGIGNQALVLGDHFLLDIGERKLFRRPLTLGLNQATANRARHATPPGLTQAKSLLCARLCDKFRWLNVPLVGLQQTDGMNAADSYWIDAVNHGNYHRQQADFFPESLLAKNGQRDNRGAVGVRLVFTAEWPSCKRARAREPRSRGLAWTWKGRVPGVVQRRSTAVLHAWRGSLTLVYLRGIRRSISRCGG